MVDVGLPLPYPTQRSYAYQDTPVHGLVTQGKHGSELSTATWWYSHKLEGDQYVPNRKITSFNARNLKADMWSEAIVTSRALVFASELGESNKKSKHLLQSAGGFALGCLYTDWINQDGSKTRSFAVITRDPIEELAQYHEKSTALFLPMDTKFIKQWLDPTVQSSYAISQVLKRPVPPEDLKVTPVKTYKKGPIQDSLF